MHGQSPAQARCTDPDAGARRRFRRLGRLAIGSGLLVGWLALSAIPALADGGPHVMSANNGSLGLNADGCAGCHRVHTAQGQLLLRAVSSTALCLTCHGSAGAGATTDVMLGIQFRAAGAVGDPGQDPGSPSAVAGALRGGGFAASRIGAGSDASSLDRPSRISFPKWDGTANQIETWFGALVPVLPAGQPATSAHLDLDGDGGVTARNTAWGNGALGSGSVGPIVELDCTTCHNPHGNGSYRILRPVPEPEAAAGTFTPAIDPGVSVTDASSPPLGEYRNYTVIEAAWLSGVGNDPTDGDYWRLYRPWDGVPTYDPGGPGADSRGIVPATASFGDQPAGTTGVTWRGQITAWCATCHTRYPANGSAVDTPSGDAVYTYRHQTNQTECTQCHVSHGSNAVMGGTASSTFPYPGEPLGTPISGSSSRLLKVDNRGTCQLCHDPTDTIPYTGVVGNP
jgi:predicted CXXCH cytochrome family protein